MKRKMKLKKFIVVAIFTLLFFIGVWIVNSIAYDKYTGAFLTNNSEASKWLLVAGIMGIVMIIAFSIITLNVVIYSSIRFFKTFGQLKNERGLWKILTLVFNIGLFVFSILITIFWLVWLIRLCKDGFSNISILQFDVIRQFGLYSFAYINNPSGLPNETFNVYVTSFVFLLIWCGGGIVFEVLKKVLGGYKAPSNESNTPNQQYYNQAPNNNYNNNYYGQNY